MLYDQNATLHDARQDAAGNWPNALIRMGGSEFAAFVPAHRPDGTVVRGGSGSAYRNHGYTGIPLAMVQPHVIVSNPNLGLTERATAQGQALAQALQASMAALYHR